MSYTDEELQNANAYIKELEDELNQLKNRYTKFDHEIADAIIDSYFGEEMATESKADSIKIKTILKCFLVQFWTTIMIGSQND